ncbi:lamin tail domain-containing protein [Luteolibacter arcticus]|uniref:Lamin tail domain-containing protein n=1 Tax=Luteolibacter arcticus TaxID=1581411 RepID=A0ABT3GHZ1_9BACT|nr:lamin tail domain-containing protein [Luteolibacter arcticus]MCW1923130.1 lamin tail domain-containing protein [Luteolibacter arcticus]
MKSFRSLARGILAGCLLVLNGMAPLRAQSVPPVDPDDALGIWDFDSTAVPSQSADVVAGTTIAFQGNTAYSADGGGRSGQAGDRAMNFGTAGNSSARITDAAFMGLLNQRNLTGDKISVVFWQRWDASIGSSSTVWFRSAASGNRGFQSHMPWSDGTIFFDHSGCCAIPSQRLSIPSSSVPGLNWQQWNHIALVKNGGTKEIWINGQPVTSSSGAAALTNDWTEVLLGQMLDSPGNVMKGRLDDFAIFTTALEQSHINALATGTKPASLLVAPIDRPPLVGSLTPADKTTFHPLNGGLGFNVSTVAPNALAPGNIRLFLNNADITPTLTIDGTATSRTVSSSATLLTNHFYNARAEVTDQAGRSSIFTWTFDTADPATIPPHQPLNLLAMATATPQVIDGNPTTFTETANSPGSFLELELDRYVRASRIELVAPAGAAYAGILNGVRLRVFGLRDQLLFETTITAVEPGGTWAVFLPAGIDARLLRLDLPAGQTNGVGDHRIALADWRVLGDPSPAVGPLDLTSIATVTQSSTNGTNTAALAIDANAATFSETQNLSNSYWLLTLDRSRPVRRVELVARADAASARLGGLTLRLLDANSNTLATTSVSHPGVGGTWGFDIPAGTAGARYLRIGLENNALNSYGDRIVSFAGVSVLTGTNYALGTPAYMVRLTDNLPSPSLANDGNHATFTETTTQTVDGYWETDLGQVRSLYSIRAIAFDSADHQKRLAHATVRLFDENRNSVYSKHLSGTSAIFDIALPGPVNARYVRIGLENKERTSATGGTEWWLRLREVQAFGLTAAETGLTGFTATPAQITSGQSSTLAWQEEGLRELSLYPGVGSAGFYVNPQGAGSLVVSPTATTEYLLVGKNHDVVVTRAVTVVVNGQSLPPRISEFVAANRFSLSDGYRQEPDWIELHNPNGTPFNLANYGLSDTTATPLKWTFPAGTVIPANGHLIVFTSDSDTPVDPAGNLHTTFSLSAGGEAVVLAAPNGSIVDSIANYPAQFDDLAYGRARAGTLGFLEPSPREHNLGTALSGWLQPPVFSHSRGFRDTPFSLTLSKSDPAAQLVYSTDGSEPAIPYAGPIAVNGSVTVRAAVRRSGYHASPSVTHTYVFRDSVMSSPLMNSTYTQGVLSTRLRSSLTQLPTICLSVPVLPDDYNERPASIEVMLPDGSPPLQVNAGLTRFGGSWTNFAKKSYRVNFRSDYGASKLESPLFRGFDRGMAAHDEINTLDLTAGNHDMVDRGFYMANRFVEDTMLEMGSLNPHGRFVHVYVNGTYWGQYNAHERLDDDFLSDYLGGPDDDYMVVRGNDNDGANFVTGTPDPEHRASWDTVRANRNSYVAVKGRLDVPHLIDFMLLWFYGNCESEYRCAGPIDPGPGFKFWLADADGFLRTSALNLDTTATAGPGGLFGALVTEGHPDFKILLADRIHRHFFNNGALTPDRNLARLNARMAEVQDSLIAECARWGYRTPANWESAAQTIRTGLFPQRTANLFTMLRNRSFYPAIDPPVLSQHGGSVSKGQAVPITAGSGTIYFTLDGSDPRLPGGGISSAALSAVATSTTFIPMGSTWRYRDIGSLPAASWHTTAYSDSGWAIGTAPLGYGTGDEASIVSYGPSASDKYRTTYFRKTFSVANPATVTGLTLGLVRDDGAVVYLNGTEVARSNMPTGTVGYTTLAASNVAGDKLTVYNYAIPPNLLVADNNVIAVEIHQSSANSTDLRFDLSLVQTSVPSIVLNGNTTVKARLRSGTTWSALTSADFQVTHPLATEGPYALSRWNSNEPAGTAPPSMRFFQTDLPDPVLATPMDLPWTLPFNLTDRSRINGLGLPGIGFINTGRPQTTPGAGFVGAAVLALDTRGSQDIRVRWTGGTVAPNERDYGIRLQYRIGNVTAFLDVPGAGGAPVEYVRNANAAHSTVLGPVSLPAAADNQPLVELRWKYYFRSGTSGSRAQLRLDEIQVTAGPVIAESLAIATAPATAQAGSVASPVIVHALGRNDVVAENFSGVITLAIAGQPGVLGGTVTRAAVNGVATFNDLVFPTPGLYTLTASASGLTGTSHAFPTRVAGLASLVMPSFIQGAYPANTLRVPHASLLRIDGLLPSATYRYAQQMVTDEDPPETDGAGNMIFATGNAGPFVRSTASPRFLPGDLGVRHGEFTTGADGSHTGWFVIEPTGNIRFTPGNAVRPRILLNDGNGGDVPFHFLTSAGSAQVRSFGTGSAEGSALHGDSAAIARNFMVLYTDAAGLTSPLAATPVEDSGAGVDSNYAPFYQSEVAGQASRWGTMIPNNLPAGVRRFEQRDRLTGQIVSVFTIPEGHDLTSGLATGSESTGIRIPAGEGFDRWQALRFTLGEIEDDALGSSSGDVDHDGVANLLEFAFGMDPFISSRSGLPVAAIETFSGSPHLVFRYRRLLGSHDLDYHEEISTTVGGWADATPAWVGSEESAPNPDGLTETVTRRLPVVSQQPRRFVRLRVEQP